jgi:hypothetical protein
LIDLIVPGKKLVIIDPRRVIGKAAFPPGVLLVPMGFGPRDEDRLRLQNAPVLPVLRTMAKRAAPLHREST